MRETILFSNNLNLGPKQLESGGFGTLTEGIFKFAKSMHQLEVDTTEYAILCAMCLLSGGTYVIHRGPWVFLNTL